MKAILKALFATTLVLACVNVANAAEWNAAVLAFRFTGAPMRMEDRFTNPLGFQVVSYRRDAETAPGVTARRGRR